MLTVRKRGRVYHADFLKGRIHVVRGSLGTRNEDAARTLKHRIELAMAAGPSSDLWSDLIRVLPTRTYLRFANYAGVRSKPLATWTELRAKFEGDMERRQRINDLAENTILSYQRVIRTFDEFLASRENPIQLVREIDNDVAREFKYYRIEAIQKKKGSTGGAGYATEVASLHRIFEFAVQSNMISKNPFQHEPKVRDPQGGAQPFSGAELHKLRENAGEEILLFLVFRWTGLRVSDVATLNWQEVDFADRSIKKYTKKSRFKKLAVIPMSDELMSALERERQRLSPQPTETVLLNPMAGHALASTNLTYRVRKLGKLAGVESAHPHRFRDTFAVDSLLKGVPESSVARMLADTLEAVIDRYLPFVKEIRDHAQNHLNTGIGLEEYADAQRRHNGRSPHSHPNLQTALTSAKSMAFDGSVH